MITTLLTTPMYPFTTVDDCSVSPLHHDRSCLRSDTPWMYGQIYNTPLLLSDGSEIYNSHITSSSSRSSRSSSSDINSLGGVVAITITSFIAGVLWAKITNMYRNWKQTRVLNNPKRIGPNQMTLRPLNPFVKYR